MTDFTQEKITIDVRCLRICDTVLDTGDFQSFYQRGSLDAVVYRVLLLYNHAHLFNHSSVIVSLNQTKQRNQQFYFTAFTEAFTAIYGSFTRSFLSQGTQ